MMEFVYPRYLWMLLGVPALLLLWGVGIWHHHRMRKRFGNLENMVEISRVSWAGHGWMQGILFAVSAFCMVIGLAYPQMLGRELRPVPMPTDVIFMLDISPSMFARDMDPSRLGRAEQIIQQFILHKLPDDRYALVSFNFNSIVVQRSDRYANLAAGRRVLDSVLNEVRDDLIDLDVVEVQRRYLGGDVAHEPMRRSRPAQPSDHFEHQRADIVPALLRLQRPCRDPRKVEEVANQAVQTRRLAFD